ncbi:MAG: hypothetical protein Unbinned4162contig1001_39 [Prokaryotic dsDNA virus sp.]|nr:MAG: hypothetical protein Unbinned4162contig1001_39 [Prokaryotic dsDNA virus sp.]|tara:strand:- start:5582 stop:5989 length:408 start_codon:yes stop_codon:yes gene_type:complete
MQFNYAQREHWFKTLERLKHKLSEIQAHVQNENSITKEVPEHIEQVRATINKELGGFSDAIASIQSGFVYAGVNVIPESEYGVAIVMEAHLREAIERMAARLGHAPQSIFVDETCIVELVNDIEQNNLMVSENGS